jgi:2'-phosphotransferase
MMVDQNSGSSRRVRGRGPRNDSPDVKLSKALSQTLRHGAEKQGIKISPDGFIQVTDLLSHSKFKNATFADIQRVVATNDKNRFSLVKSDQWAVETDPSGWLIRANQGHSLLVEVELRPLLQASDFPKNVIHGTTLKAWQEIKQKGISKMGRLHIHLASGKPDENHVISGVRSFSTVFIYIDVEAALAANIPFFESANGVILSPGDQDGFIPKECFLKVEDRQGDLKEL